MALIKCPECGREISDRAISCPNCGYPISEACGIVVKQDINCAESIRNNESGFTPTETIVSTNTDSSLVPIKKEKKKLKVWQIALMGIAVAAIILILITLFGNRNDAKADINQTYTWPSKGLATLLPIPESNIGEIRWDASYGFNIYVAETSSDAFNAYIDSCSNEGFDIDYQRGSDYYYAYNSEGNRLELRYEDNVMKIQIRESQASANETDYSVTEGTQIVTSNNTVEDHNTYRTDGFEYIVLSDGTAEITKYIGNDTSVSISTVDGHNISAIGKEAFKNCVSLSELWLSSNVISIGESAFEGCTSLIEVDVKAVTVGDAAFKDCTSLEELWFSSEVVNIGKSAFEGCISLVEVDVKAPTIGEAAFKNCTSLTELWFSSEVVNIEKSAFEGCTSLIEVDLKAPVIGAAAFKGCSSLTEIWFSSNVKSVGKSAFEDCTSLREISGSTKTIEFDATAFFNCPKLTELPDGIVITNNTEGVTQTEESACEETLGPLYEINNACFVSSARSFMKRFDKAYDGINSVNYSYARREDDVLYYDLMDIANGYESVEFVGMVGFEDRNGTTLSVADDYTENKICSIIVLIEDVDDVAMILVGCVYAADTTANFTEAYNVAIKVAECAGTDRGYTHNGINYIVSTDDEYYFIVISVDNE